MTTESIDAIQHVISFQAYMLASGLTRLPYDILAVYSSKAQDSVSHLFQQLHSLFMRTECSLSSVHQGLKLMCSKKMVQSILIT